MFIADFIICIYRNIVLYIVYDNFGWTIDFHINMNKSLHMNPDVRTRNVDKNEAFEYTVNLVLNCNSKERTHIVELGTERD